MVEIRGEIGILGDGFGSTESVPQSESIPPVETSWGRVSTGRKNTHLNEVGTSWADRILSVSSKIVIVCLLKMLHNLEVITDYLNIFASYMCFKDLSIAA